MWVPKKKSINPRSTAWLSLIEIILIKWNSVTIVYKWQCSYQETLSFLMFIFMRASLVLFFWSHCLRFRKHTDGLKRINANWDSTYILKVSILPRHASLVLGVNWKKTHVSSPVIQVGGIQCYRYTIIKSLICVYEIVLITSVAIKSSKTFLQLPVNEDVFILKSKQTPLYHYKLLAVLIVNN